MAGPQQLKRHKVRWTQEAAGDLRDIIHYIRDRETVGRARKILQQIRRRASCLEMAPERGRCVPELERQFGLKVYRELIEGPWRILYRIEDKLVLVVRVLDGRRDVQDLLLRSLLRPPQ